MGDQLVGTRHVSSDGDTNVSIPSSAGKNFTVTATLTDSVYYSDKTPLTVTNELVCFLKAIIYPWAICAGFL